MRKKEKLNGLARKVYQMLKMFWLCNATDGIMPFYYGAPFLSDEEICDIQRAELRRRLGDRFNNEKAHVQGGDGTTAIERMVESADRVHEIIRKCGGLEAISEELQFMAKAAPYEWRLLEQWAQKGGYRFPTVQTIANAGEIIREKAYYDCNKFLRETAREIARKAKERRQVNA